MEEVKTHRIIVGKGMEGVKILRLQAIGDHAILIISDRWLYIKEFPDRLVLYKEPLLDVSEDPK